MPRDKVGGMSASAATRPSPKVGTPWSPSQAGSIPSTTPTGYPAWTPGSTGQRTPRSPAKALSPHGRGPLRASSPNNYFEFVSNSDMNPPNSNAGIHARKNWSPVPGSDQPNPAASPEKYPLESQKRYENFRRESESSTFKLSQGSLPSFSTSSGTRISPPYGGASETARMPRASSGSPASHESIASPRMGATGAGEMQVDPPDDLNQISPRPLDSNLFFGQERRDSPASDFNLDLSSLRRSQLSHIDERHPRNSLPHNRADPPHTPVQRSETLPSSLSTDGPTMLAPEGLGGIFKDHQAKDILLLDLRVYPQYSKSRIDGALNLCIPTTLLKRASFNIQRLAETFTKESERAKFDTWRDVKIILVYDGATVKMQEATSCVNILKKFQNEKWQGATFILRGGFNGFSKKFPDRIDHRPANLVDGSNMKGLSIDPPASAPVAGGCAMPANQTAANPFFGTIRQNMDLIGGVGQMPITIPSALKDKPNDILPSWLSIASDAGNKGKFVADHFLDIERAEEQRMKKALSANVSYGTPDLLSPNNVQIAGIEKGTKNRYKDILPYDHTRVKLQGVPVGDCDYVNANHVQAKGSNKRYIASQAPVPATFQDFWRVVWEQDARVIVMLTAETEGGNRKSHPYWVPASYGSFKVKSLSERKTTLDRSYSSKPSRTLTSPTKSTPLSPQSNQRPSMPNRRHSSKHSLSSMSSKNSSPSSPLDFDAPHVIIRKVALSDTSKPFEPLREITQLQYSSWPDFGAPAHPAHVLGLVERCSDVVRSYEQGPKAPGLDEPAKEGERPVVVHCSAGCGRTGTFCTIDSVIDMLKSQRAHRRNIHSENKPYRAPSPEDNGVHDSMDDGAMDVDAPSSSQQQPPPAAAASDGKLEQAPQELDWLHHDRTDLVGRTVADFRLQRLSMVQTLRQYVLCYESVLEWLAGEVEREAGKGWTGV